MSHAHKIDKREAIIDWSQPAEIIERRVRAFQPYPGAHTALAGKAIKIWDTELEHGASTAGRPAGEILAVGDAGIVVACGTGALRLTGLQRAGGKRLRAREFLAGLALAPGQRLGAVPEGEP